MHVRLSPPADYPYPLDVKGQPIDTPEWRDASRLEYHAPTPQEKVKVDSDLFKAVRGFGDGGMEAVDAAIAAGADLNAKDKVHWLARIPGRSP